MVTHCKNMRERRHAEGAKEEIKTEAGGREVKTVGEHEGGGE